MKTQSQSTLIKHVSSAKLNTIRKRFVSLYGIERADLLLDRFYHLIGRYGIGVSKNSHSRSLSQRDAVLITYADMVSDDDKSPLAALREFCTARLKGSFSAIHILPFYPWTSDDGFSVVDYREVKESYGDWEDLSKLS